MMFGDIFNTGWGNIFHQKNRTLLILKTHRLVNKTKTKTKQNNTKQLQLQQQNNNNPHPQ